MQQLLFLPYMSGSLWMVQVRPSQQGIPTRLSTAAQDTPMRAGSVLRQQYNGSPAAVLVQSGGLGLNEPSELRQSCPQSWRFKVMDPAA